MSREGRVMEAVLNDVTTPIEEKPDYCKVGVIKVLWENEKIPIGRIIYEHFWNEEFQYIFELDWKAIDSLVENAPASFHGIPGLNMDLKKDKYYRVNKVPAFIIQRTPPRNREDLMEMMEKVGLDHYDRFEWLIRTKDKASQDNLIVEKE